MSVTHVNHGLYDILSKVSANELRPYVFNVFLADQDPA